MSGCFVFFWYSGLGLECYRCSNEDDNDGDCTSETHTCDQFQDACTSYIRWAGRFPHQNDFFLCMQFFLHAVKKILAICDILTLALKEIIADLIFHCETKLIHGRVKRGNTSKTHKNLLNIIERCF